MDKFYKNYLEGEASVFYLRCNCHGDVLGSNKFTGEILGFEPSGKNIREIFVDFHQELDILKLVNEGSEKLLNITTYTGLPESLYFRFYESGEDYLIFGRYNFMELENLRKDVLQLNMELNSLTRQLQKQKSELEKLNKLKDQFLGMAAHDLRKPVGVIMNFTEFLEEDISDKLDDEQKTFLRMIHKSSLFMRQIINDFLDVALIEAGEFKLDLNEVELSELIKENIYQHQIIAKSSGIEIQLIDESPETGVNCDTSKIEQVLNNLIGNAIEHSEKGGVIIILINKIGNYLKVTVKDNGSGISEEKQKEIFDIFGKDKRKLRGKKSIGLGLAISKRIIESHKGNIWVESRPGAGASFIFTLPK